MTSYSPSGYTAWAGGDASYFTTIYSDGSTHTDVYVNSNYKLKECFTSAYVLWDDPSEFFIQTNIVVDEGVVPTGNFTGFTQKGGFSIPGHFASTSTLVQDVYGDHWQRNGYLTVDTYGSTILSANVYYDRVPEDWENPQSPMIATAHFLLQGTFGPGAAGDQIGRMVAATLPEPASLSFLAVGVLGLSRRRRKGR